MWKCILILASLGIFLQAMSAPVYLPEDEFTLPPLLYRIETQSGTPDNGVNIESSTDRAKRRALDGEWLRYGDRLDLNSKIALQVIQKENIMWISGGVFQGKIGSLNVKDDRIYEVVMDRGWIRVWVKPGADGAKIQVRTAHGIFQASNAEFWLSTRPAQTEIYLIAGEVKRLGNNIPFVNRSYAIFETGKILPRYVAKSWDPDAIEVTLSASYPSLGKLVLKASEDWIHGKSSRIYADYRKKGWRKADPKQK